MGSGGEQQELRKAARRHSEGKVGGTRTPRRPPNVTVEEIKTSNQDEPRKSGQSHPSSPTAIADDFIDPTLLTATQREEMLSEMALAAKAAQDLMLREQNGETRLPSDGK